MGTQLFVVGLQPRIGLPAHHLEEGATEDGFGRMADEACVLLVHIAVPAVPIVEGHASRNAVQDDAQLRLADEEGPPRLASPKHCRPCGSAGLPVRRLCGPKRRRCPGAATMILDGPTMYQRIPTDSRDA